LISFFYFFLSLFFLFTVLQTRLHSNVIIRSDIRVQTYLSLSLSSNKVLLLFFFSISWCLVYLSKLSKLICEKSFIKKRLKNEEKEKERDGSMWTILIWKKEKNILIFVKTCCDLDARIFVFVCFFFCYLSIFFLLLNLNFFLGLTCLFFFFFFFS